MPGWQGVQAAGPGAHLCPFPHEHHVSWGDPFPRASQVSGGCSQALPCAHKGPQGKRWPPQDPQLCSGETGQSLSDSWKDVDF